MRSARGIARIGRNDPCHCGSGQKYKRCCLSRDEAIVSEPPAEPAAKPAELVAQKAFGERANLDARKRYAGRYLTNTLKNLPVIAREGNASALFNAFKGIPAIIVSAGPSLDRNIEELREFSDRAIVIAVDTALRVLLGAGLVPHLVVSIDPSEVNSPHLTNLQDQGGTWLVAEGSLDPVVFEQFEGRTFVFKVSDHHPWPWLRGLGLDREIVRAWGSVATSAFDLALKMGCDPVIFTGQDLAYKNGQLYCRGTTFEDVWAERVLGGEELPDIWAHELEQDVTEVMNDLHGHPVVTTPELVAFRNWFDEQAALLEPQRVINATGDGILYGSGIRQAGLGSILASLPPLRGVDARVRESWGTMTGGASADPMRAGPKWFAAFARASREELTTWASFAIMTTSALSAELDGVGAVLQDRLVDAAQDRRPTEPALGLPRVDPHRQAVVHAPELTRGFLAATGDEPLPAWAQSAAAIFDSRDPSALRERLYRLPPELLRVTAERCENAGAFEHAAVMYSWLADRWKQEGDAAQVRSATIGWLRSLVCAGDFEAARTLIDRERLLPDERAVVYLCSIYQMTGDHERAVAMIEELVTRFPDMPGLRVNLALSLALAGNLRGALEQIDVDETRWPGRPVSRFARGSSRRLHGDYEAAVATLAALVDEWPPAAPELVVASVATQQRESIDRSLRAFRTSFRGPAAFVMVPDGQSVIVDEAVKRLGAELATEDRCVERRRLSPIAVVLVVQPVDAWRPRWQP